MYCNDLNQYRGIEMTEDEAKTKWCPHVRVMSDEGSMVIATVNRGSVLQAQTNCIASDCMMWVWDEEQKRTGNSSDISGHCGLVK